MTAGMGCRSQITIAVVSLVVLTAALGAGCQGIDAPAPKSGAAAAAFDHTNTTSGCAACHAAERPAGPVHGFDHATNGGGGDCSSCHLSNRGTSWAPGNFNHSPTPAACASCHTTERPTGPTGNPSFDHAKAGMGDCVSCHGQSAGQAWAGGRFSHDPAPASCSDCHQSEQPSSITREMSHAHAGLGDCAGCHQQSLANSPPQSWSGGQFSHQPGPATCDDCHGPQRPVGAVGNPSFDHANGGQGDCGSCHQKSLRSDPPTSWSGGYFSHSPTPSSCGSCHQSEQPSDVVSEMSHSHSGIGDCAGCHQKNVGTSWSGGTLSHSPMPTSCQDCHAGQRPSGTVGNPPFNHASGGQGDCVSCHTRNVGVSWSGGSFNHQPAPSGCSSCHSGERPSGNVGNPPYNHANGGTGDCVSCHKASLNSNPPTSWAGGNFSHSPAPSSCGSCHRSEQPSALTHEMAHSHSGIGDCAGCHQSSLSSNPPTSWNGGTFNHSPTPSSCQDCHGPQRPGSPVGNPPFDHSKSGTGDCAGCHSKNAGVTWSGSMISHSPVPSSCDGCHEKVRPAVANYPDNAGQHQGHYTQSDCYSCHLPASSTVTSFTFNHVDANNREVGTCLPCHLSKGQRKHGSNVKDCASCHSDTREW